MKRDTKPENKRSSINITTVTPSVPEPGPKAWSPCPTHPVRPTESQAELRELIAQILQYVNDVEDSIKLQTLSDNTVLLNKGDLIRRMTKGIYRGYNLGA